jgi:hypothetical protein
VFTFAEEADAEAFKKEFGGEPHPSEKGHGKDWAWWKKGTHIQNHKVHELVD